MKTEKRSKRDRTFRNRAERHARRQALNAIRNLRIEVAR